jgi:hypothetical protein
LTGISNTIVVNLGGSDDDNKNEEEDIGKSLTKDVPTQRKDAMGNKYNNGEEDNGANIIGNK